MFMSVAGRQSYLPPPQFLPVGIQLDCNEVRRAEVDTAPVSLRPPGEDDRSVLAYSGGVQTVVKLCSVLLKPPKTPAR